MLELGLEGIYPTDALFIRLELLRLAHAKRAVQEGHGVSVAVVPGGSDGLYRLLSLGPERHAERLQMVPETHPESGGHAAVALDQRRPAAAGPGTGRCGIPRPAQVADPVLIGEGHHLVDVAVPAVDLAQLPEYHRHKLVGGEDRGAAS